MVFSDRSYGHFGHLFKWDYRQFGPHNSILAIHNFSPHSLILLNLASVDGLFYVLFFEIKYLKQIIFAIKSTAWVQADFSKNSISCNSANKFNVLALIMECVQYMEQRELVNESVLFVLDQAQLNEEKVVFGAIKLLKNYQN